MYTSVGTRTNGAVGKAVSREAWQDGEHPEVVVDDIASRPRPDARIIVFANEKGGVGKSTLAFHTAIALAHKGQRVVAIDLDRNQQSLARALVNRAGSATNLKARLPVPAHAVLEQPCAAQLVQEINRIGRDADFIVLDTAGADSPIMRRAIAMADTLVTPINCSFVDLDMIAHIDPVTGHARRAGHFTSIVSSIREERLRQGLKDCDWVVLKNRLRSMERKQQSRVDAAIERLSREFDFRVASPLKERVTFRELFLFGLIQADLKLIPGAPAPKRAGINDLDRLVADLDLTMNPPCAIRPAIKRAPVIERVGEAFRESLFAQL